MQFLIAATFTDSLAKLGGDEQRVVKTTAFAEAWPDVEIVQQLVGRLPWGHNLVLMTKLKDPAVRRQYAERVIEHGWSRNVLNIHFEARLLEREGKAVTNFEARLPAPQSDLARNTLKDPYLFDFLGVGKEADEREVESALVQHISRFLLELGAGFALRDSNKPIGVAEYQLVESLPKELQTNLPSVEQIERELGGSDGGD